MKLEPNIFTSYELTEQEIVSGSILTELQTAVIQNRLATIVKAKLELKLDCNNINLFVQQEADLAGRMVELQSILDASAYHLLAILEQRKGNNDVNI